MREPGKHSVGAAAALAGCQGVRYSARMSARMLAFGGLVVAGVVAALFVALRRGDLPEHGPAAATPPPGATRSGGAAAPGPSAARAPRPSLPAGKPSALGTTGVDDAPLWTVYDHEERDPSWATAREQAIRARLDALLDGVNRATPDGVQVPQVECREIHCRLLITGSDQRGFQSFVESLQDERGFYGDAALLALDGYGEQVDERTGRAVYQVRVHLKYDR